MYVCVCNAITDRDIRHAIRSGATTVGQLKDQLQVSTACGSCADHVENCLGEFLTTELSCNDLLSI